MTITSTTGSQPANAPPITVTKQEQSGPFPWGLLMLGLCFFAIAAVAFIIRATTVGSDGANADGRL